MGQVMHELDSAPETTDTASTSHPETCRQHCSRAEPLRGEAERPDSNIPAGSSGELLGVGGFFCSPRAKWAGQLGNSLIKILNSKSLRSCFDHAKRENGNATSVLVFLQRCCRCQERDLGGADIYYTVSQSYCAKTKMASRVHPRSNALHTRGNCMSVHQLHVKKPPDVFLTSAEHKYVVAKHRSGHDYWCEPKTFSLPSFSPVCWV